MNAVIKFKLPSSYIDNQSDVDKHIQSYTMNIYYFWFVSKITWACTLIIYE